MKGFREYIEESDRCDELYNEIIETIVEYRIDPRQLVEAVGRTAGATIGGVLGGALGGGFGAVPGAMLGGWLGGLGDRWARRGRTPELAPLYQQAATSVNQLLDALQKTDTYLARSSFGIYQNTAKQHLKTISDFLNKTINDKVPQQMDQEVKTIESGKKPYIRGDAPADVTSPLDAKHGGWHVPKDKGFLGRLKDKWYGADRWTEKHPYLTQGAAMLGGMGLGALANWGVNALHRHGDHGTTGTHDRVHGQESRDPKGIDKVIGDERGGDLSLAPLAQGPAGVYAHGTPHQVWRPETGDAQVWRQPDGSHVYQTQDGSWLRSSTPSWGEPDSLWHTWNGSGWGRGHLHPKR